mgnify:CR=1 FL=1
MILILILIVVFLIFICYSNKEYFTSYVKFPFKYQDIGTSPIVMYNKPLYRKPYRYPYMFKSSYPINYMRYY